MAVLKVCKDLDLLEFSPTFLLRMGVIILIGGDVVDAKGLGLDTRRHEINAMCVSSCRWISRYHSAIGHIYYDVGQEEIVKGGSMQVHNVIWEGELEIHRRISEETYTKSLALTHYRFYMYPTKW
jgi:hypothetical protein